MGFLDKIHDWINEPEDRSDCVKRYAIFYFIAGLGPTFILITCLAVIAITYEIKWLILSTMFCPLIWMGSFTIVCRKYLPIEQYEAKK